jgi:hypothetical protein
LETVNERKRISDKSEWSTWKCAVLTGALCAIPLLLPFLKHPVAVFAVWVILLLAYLGLVKMFGSGFVVAGAIIVVLFAILFFLLSPWFFSWYYEKEVSSADSKREILIFQA